MKLLLCIYLMVLFTNAIHVTFSFDDAWDNHYNASKVLDSYGLHATFYINSERINQEGRLSLQQLKAMNKTGHEIAGHTKTHARLTDLSHEQQEEEICADRGQLLAWGFRATSFAYPYGANTDNSYEILVKCGYNSARDSGGLRSNESCTSCPAGEFIPPKKPYLMRSISYSKQRGLETMKWYIRQAEEEESLTLEDRWVNLVFHEFGDFPSASQAITEQEFRSFLDWVTARPGMHVKTTDEIVGGRSLPILSDLPDIHNDGKPYILFTFDDGTEDHKQVAETFEEFGMEATFFINTANLEKPGFLKFNDLQKLSKKGHEIGGHGRTGKHLLQLTREEQVEEVCGAKEDLEKKQINDVISLSWAYGETNQQLQKVASECGFKLGRDVGGIKSLTGCNSCPWSLHLPLSKPLALRSFNVKSFHTLGYLIWQIRQAEEESFTGKRGLVFTFGKVCNGCQFSPTVLRNLLIWLKPRYKLGTTVATLSVLNE
jgi:peptidoglycan/xylan/chitin deacetylase (PgdA/CDA1 family)